MKSFYIIVATVISILAFSGGVYLGFKSGYSHGKIEFEFGNIETQEPEFPYKNEYVDDYDSIYQRQIKY